MRNKITALVLTLCLTLSNTICFGSTPKKIDTPNEMASALLEMKLIAGDRKGLRLEDTLTRAESLVLITKLTGKLNQIQQYNLVKLPFKDVKTNEWYTPYIKFAYDNKIAVGVSNTQFSPSSPVSEKEFKKMLLSALGYEMPQDFTWDNLEAFSYALGFTELQNARMNRSGAFTLTFETLLQSPKNKSATVLEQLTLDKQIDINAFKMPHVKNLLQPNLVAKITNSLTAKQTSISVNMGLQNTPTAPQNSSTAAPAANTTPAVIPAGTVPTPTVTPTTPPIQNKSVISINFTSEWIEPNTLNIYFQESLDRGSIEQFNAVRIYLTNGSEPIELPVKNIVYVPSEKKLRLDVNGGEHTKVCKIVFNERLIKTQAGNPVKFKETPNLVVAKSTFSVATITPNCITLKCEPEFDPNSLSNVATGKVVFERLKKTVSIIKTEYNKDYSLLKLHTDLMPELSNGKIIMPNFTTDSGVITFTDYAIPIKTGSFNFPQVELVESSTNNLINVHYSMDMDYSSVSRASNYELYDTTVALQNRIGIEQIQVVDQLNGSRHVVLRINNMVEGKTYKLKILHMRAQFGNEMQETEAFTFKAMASPSTAKLNGAQSTIDNRLVFSFSEPMDLPSVLRKENYEVTCKGNKDIPLNIQSLKHNDSTQSFEMQFTNADVLNNENLMIQLDAKNLKDASGKVLLPTNSKFFCMNWDRKLSVKFDNLRVTSPSSIQMNANTDLNASTAMSVNNYKLTDASGNATALKVIKATYVPDSRLVQLDFDGSFIYGNSYKIIISNVQTTAGVPATAPIELIFTPTK